MKYGALTAMACVAAVAAEDEVVAAVAAQNIA